MKKVIFVGGTSFSGSTLLDMLLSNDPRGMSLGEIYALKYPFRTHHLQERINLVKHDPKWNRIINASTDQFYTNLINLFPEKDFFVDSSKHPIWIHKNVKALQMQNVKVYNLLIYKSPVEIAESFKKRKRWNEWPKSWINYHKLYFSLIDDFYVIGYKDLVAGHKNFKEICQKVGIQYFDEKFNFWSKKQPTFFGNNRTRYHTFQNNDELKEFTEKNEGTYDPLEYRKIYYKEVADKNLIKAVEIIIQKKPQIEKIIETFKNKALNIPNNLKSAIPEIMYKNLQMIIRAQFYRSKQFIYSTLKIPF